MSVHSTRLRGNRRVQIFCEDGWRCYRCMIPLTVPIGRQRKATDATLDHVIPCEDFARRGVTDRSIINHPSNLLSCCWTCNSVRGKTPLHQWLGAETLQRLIRDYPRVAATIVELMRTAEPTQVLRVAA